jgi:integrase
MPTLKLTQRDVEKLPAPSGTGKQVIYWDGGWKKPLVGFGVLVSGISPSKAYIVQAAVKGVTRRITIGKCNLISCDEARKNAAGVLADLTKGIDPKATKRGVPTLDEAFKQFLEARSGGLSKNSVSAYTSLVLRHLEPWLKTPINLISTDMIEARHRKLGEDVGPAAANGTMRALRLLWNFVLEKKPDLGPNPVRLRKQWHKLPIRTGLVKAEELPAFYAAVCALLNDVHRDYLLMLLFTGLRRREAAALRWDHIDFKAKTMRIPAESTKSGKKLDLPLSDFLLDMLVARRALGDAGGWIFPSNSAIGNLTEPKYALDAVERASGIEVSPHDLRRTYITVAESCDISVMSLMALVNHSAGKSVTAGYVQLTPERLREPAQKVANKLKELCGIKDVTGNVARLR